MDTVSFHLKIKIYSTLHIVRCAILAVMYTAGTESSKHKVHCTVYSVHCTVYSVQCITVYTVQCTVYSVHCTVRAHIDSSEWETLPISLSFMYFERKPETCNLGVSV